MAAIRVSLAFRREPDAALFAFGLRIDTNLTGNPHFPDPPLVLGELKGVCTAFEQAIIAARDGGKWLIDARGKQRQALLQILRELAAYVQFTAKGEVSKIYSSGFDIASRNTTPTRLPKPNIISVFNCASTQLQLKVPPLKNARIYDVWIHTGDGNWKAWQLFQNTRRMILQNLTPGQMYWIRVRVLGGSTGSSEWSDAISHMSI